MICFSESTMGFYDSRFNKNIPNDAVEVSESLRDSILSGSSGGGGIEIVNGLPSIVIKTPKNAELFKAEFNALKAEHESEINQLNLAFASAALVDGATQESKQAEIRAAYQLAVSENQASVNALMVKYYG